MNGQMIFIGKKIWAIAEGYVPEWSRETLCMLNTTKVDAQVQITVYFPDRDPVGPYHVVVPGERTLHVRLNELKDPEPIPRGKDYATVVESTVPIVVQHTRLESRQAEIAPMTTIAYAQ